MVLTYICVVGELTFCETFTSCLLYNCNHTNYDWLIHKARTDAVKRSGVNMALPRVKWNMLFKRQVENCRNESIHVCIQVKSLQETAKYHKKHNIYVVFLFFKLNLNFLSRKLVKHNQLWLQYGQGDKFSIEDIKKKG